MRIKNFEIKNFRNIVSAKVTFGGINIITGKNSSGKSNFLLALDQALSTKKDYSEVFKGNIVTYGPGKKQTLFKVAVEDIKSRVIISEVDKYTYIQPEEFVYEKVIEKKHATAKSQKLFFSGKYSIQYKKDFLPKERMAKIFEIFDKKAETLKDRLVYSVLNSSSSDVDSKKIINRDQIPENDREFFEIFHDYFNDVKSWLLDSNFSSNLIYTFVTERLSNEMYEQIVNFLNSKSGSIEGGSFGKAKFINLLADVQKVKSVSESFRSDLHLYTKGIISDVSIVTKGRFGNKGEIQVTSPQGPKDIFTVSTGTAVLIYFILLKNWLELKRSDRSFSAPSIMIFDEIDSILHPSLMDEFHELLRIISKKTQLFIATHSAVFIDYFNKNEIYLLKDLPSLPIMGESHNRCNIYDYQSIIKSLPKERQKDYLNKSNSELYIEGLIDGIFPSSTV